VVSGVVCNGIVRLKLNDHRLKPVVSHDAMDGVVRLKLNDHRLKPVVSHDAMGGVVRLKLNDHRLKSGGVASFTAAEVRWVEGWWY
jgi:hypothetical protein